MEQRRKKSVSKRGRPPQKKPAAASAKKTKKTNSKPAPENAVAKNREKSELNSILQTVAPYILIVLSIYILVTFFVTGPESVGGVGVFTRNIFYGLFGAVAILVPIFAISIAVFMKSDIKSGFFKYRLIFSAICLVLFASMFHLGWKESPEAGYNLGQIFENGTKSNGGGVFGGYLAETLRRCVGGVGAWIFVLPLSAVFGIFLFGFTPQGLIKRIVALVREYKENRPHSQMSEIKNRREPAPQPQNAAPRIKQTGKTFENDTPIDLANSQKSRKKPNQNGFEMGDNPFANNFTDEIEQINKKNTEDQINIETLPNLPEVPEKEMFGSNDAFADENGETPEPEDFERFEVGELENLDSVPIERDDEPEEIASENAMIFGD
ncbi:MAG: DNA translocase FtsK 4TM domain-containing protein, partial [Oscillospiraceae bacterium]|nr:DNA translocase FtsK 4TM domain-containing protein [Oscillospiraceae bacterium]